MGRYDQKRLPYGGPKNILAMSIFFVSYLLSAHTLCPQLGKASSIHTGLSANTIVWGPGFFTGD